LINKLLKAKIPKAVQVHQLSQAPPCALLLASLRMCHFPEDSIFPKPAGYLFICTANSYQVTLWHLEKQDQ
jgi:hypothetical protein